VTGEALREFIGAGVACEGLDVRVVAEMPRTFSGKADRHGLSLLDG
jgi:hypothetical protein